MVLGKALEPKPGHQEAPRAPKTAKNQPCKIQEIRFSECQWAAQIFSGVKAMVLVMVPASRKPPKSPPMEISKLTVVVKVCELISDVSHD